MIVQRIDGTVAYEAKGKFAAVLQEAIWHGVDLTDLRLEVQNLSGVDFTRANLYNAEIRKCDLTDCNFTETNLRRSVLYECKGERTNFQAAQMDNVNIIGCEWFEADFSGAQMSDLLVRRTFFTGCDFNRVRGHRFTSTNNRFRSCQLRYTGFFDGLCRDCRFTNCDFTGSEMGLYQSERNTCYMCEGRVGRSRRPRVIKQERNLAEEQAVKWAKKLHSIRVAHGHTIEYAAAATGLAPDSIRRLALGESINDAANLIAMLRLYKLTLADLYYGCDIGGTDETAMGLDADEEQRAGQPGTEHP